MRLRRCSRQVAPRALKGLRRRPGIESIRCSLSSFFVLERRAPPQLRTAGVLVPSCHSSLPRLEEVAWLLCSSKELSAAACLLAMHFWPRGVASGGRAELRPRSGTCCGDPVELWGAAALARWTALWTARAVRSVAVRRGGRAWRHPLPTLRRRRGGAAALHCSAAGPEALPGTVWDVCPRQVLWRHATGSRRWSSLAMRVHGIRCFFGPSSARILRGGQALGCAGGRWARTCASGR